MGLNSMGNYKYISVLNLFNVCPALASKNGGMGFCQWWVSVFAIKSYQPSAQC